MTGMIGTVSVTVTETTASAARAMQCTFGGCCSAPYAFTVYVHSLRAARTALSRPSPLSCTAYYLRLARRRTHLGSSTRARLDSTNDISSAIPRVKRRQLWRTGLISPSECARRGPSRCRALLSRLLHVARSHQECNLIDFTSFIQVCRTLAPCPTTLQLQRRSVARASVSRYTG